jgi:AraC-like DNA-binding protein
MIAARQVISVFRQRPVENCKSMRHALLKPTLQSGSAMIFEDRKLDAAAQFSGLDQPTLMKQGTSDITLFDHRGIQTMLNVNVADTQSDMSSGLTRVALRFARRSMSEHSTVLRGSARAGARQLREFSRVTMTRGMLGLIDAHDPFESENKSRFPQYVDYLAIDPSWLSSLASQICGLQNASFKIPPNILFQDAVLFSAAVAVVDAHLSRIAAHGADAITVDQTAIDTLQHLLGVILLTRHTVGLPSKRSRARPLPLPSLNRVMEYIDAHLAANIGMVELAHVARLSEHQFIRCFSMAAGRTPHQFVMKKRIERARQLLKATRLPISQIALDTGFASQTHLTQLFRANGLSTPAQHRLP